jgi:hypothetical protein
MSKRPTHPTHSQKPSAAAPPSTAAHHEGKGGSRRGYRSSNEIEDMEIFDEEPGKRPSGDGLHDAKSIDENGYRERK